MGKRLKKGSVTVYLSLTMLLLMSLIAAALYSARQAACRAALASGTEQGLYSLFAQYDRDLFERFGLLMIDGGYGTAQLRLGTLLRETEEDISRVIVPSSGTADGRNILGMQIEGRAVEGYRLATDLGGAPFRRQICKLSLGKTGMEDIRRTDARLSGEKETAGQLMEMRNSYSEADAPVLYPEEYPDDEATYEVEVPEGFVNPLDQIDLLRGQALAALVLPEYTPVSGAALSPAELVSGRSLNRGMGIPDTAAGETGDRFFLLSYLLDEFSCFTSERKGTGLQYQVEYAVGRQSSDEANMQYVLDKLMTIREAANMVYLMSSESRREEAAGMAALISAVMLRPDLQPTVSYLLMAAWAYGESLEDLRVLTGGGRVPLQKDDGTWQLPLYALPWAGTYRGYGTGSSEGLDYTEYLGILLMDRSEQDLTASLMDLVEYVMREERSREHFRLDLCIEAVRLSFEAAAGRNTYLIERQYAYE